MAGQYFCMGKNGDGSWRHDADGLRAVMHNAADLHIDAVVVYGGPGNERGRCGRRVAQRGRFELVDRALDVVAEEVGAGDDEREGRLRGQRALVGVVRGKVGAATVRI